MTRGGTTGRANEADTFELPAKAAAPMRGFKAHWGIAGGWAIDLYLGRQTRAHADMEIAVLRRDQTALRAHFRGWHWQKVVEGELADWPAGEQLTLPVFELYCRNEAAELPAELRQLEILLNEARGRTWLFRRDARITRPLAASYLTSAAGLNFLAPEIVLLYKSKQPRPKDEQDFAAAVGRLEIERKDWLRAALASCSAGHHWLKQF